MEDLGTSATLQKSNLPLRLIVFQSFANIAPGAVVGVFMTGIVGVALGSTPLVMVLAFVLFFLSLNANYQFSKRIAHAGGYYGYVGNSLGKRAGFYAGMFYVMNGLTGGAAFGMLQFAVFSYFLFPQLSTIPFSWIPFFVISAAFVVALTYRGIRLNLLYVTITGLIEMSVLYVGAIILIIFAGSHNTLSVFTPVYIHNNLSILFYIVIINLLSFVGAGSVITLSEEAKDPSRNIGKAIVLVIGLGILPVVISSYAFTVYYGPLNMAQFASLADPGVIIFKSALGPIFAYVFAALVMNSALSVGIAIFNATSRTLYGMAREGLLPSFLNYIHPKFRTPTRIILLMAIVDVILSIIAVSTLGFFNGFFFLASVTAIPVLIAHLLTNASLPVFIRRHEKTLGSPWKVITNFIAPIITVVIFGIAIYYSVVPLPVWPNTLIPFLALAWFIFVTALVVLISFRHPSVFKEKVLNKLEIKKF